MLRKEILLAAALSTAITNSRTSVLLWSDDASDPITDVLEGHESIVSTVQEVPTVLMLPWLVILKLWKHPLILERIKAGGTPTNPAVVNLVALAQVFAVDEVLVSRAFKNTAGKDATAVQSDIWAGTGYLAIVPPRPGLRTLTMATTFAWKVSGGNNGRVVMRWRDDRVSADFVVPHYYYDQKIVSADSGFKLDSLI